MKKIKTIIIMLFFAQSVFAQSKKEFPNYFGYFYGGVSQIKLGRIVNGNIFVEGGGSLEIFPKIKTKRGGNVGLGFRIGDHFNLEFGGSFNKSEGVFLGEIFQTKYLSYIISGILFS